MLYEPHPAQPQTIHLIQRFIDGHDDFESLPSDCISSNGVEVPTLVLGQMEEVEALTKLQQTFANVSSSSQQFQSWDSAFSTGKSLMLINNLPLAMLAAKLIGEILPAAAVSKYGASLLTSGLYEAVERLCAWIMERVTHQLYEAAGVLHSDFWSHVNSLHQTSAPILVQLVDWLLLNFLSGKREITEEILTRAISLLLSGWCVNTQASMSPWVFLTLTFVRSSVFYWAEDEVCSKVRQHLKQP